MEARKNDKGEVVFEETSDELFNRWEQEHAAGKDPDLTDGLPKEEVERIRQRIVDAEMTVEAKKRMGEAFQSAEPVASVGAQDTALPTDTQALAGCLQRIHGWQEAVIRNRPAPQGTSDGE